MQHSDPKDSTSSNTDADTKSAEIQQDLPPRRPGTTHRPRRLRVHRARQADQIGCDERTGDAQTELDALQQEQLHISPSLRRAVAKLAPTSTSPRRADVDPAVEVAAARRLSAMVWLEAQLLAASRGRPTDRRFALAALTYMATLGRRPEVQSAARALRVSPLTMYAFGFPTAPARASLYEQIHGICSRHSTTVMLHVNLELIRRLAERRNEAGKIVHPDIARIGVVDATLLEAHVLQYMPRGPAERRAMLDDCWDKVGYVIYKDSHGNTTKRCHGYKLVAICDLASTLPLVWTLTPASYSERDAARKLLDILFRIWPDCPMTTLVGDALYDQEEAFAWELEFNWGLHPCFPRAGKVSRAFPYADTHGVPTCAHGLMHREKAEGFPDASWRSKTGTPRGQSARENDARIRWRCPIKDPACATQTTRPRDNPRLYTFLPHVGGSPAADIRRALLMRRNSVESCFASLKNRGIGGTGQQRLKLTGDDAADWVTSLAATYLTAGRVAHETGLYEQELDVVDELGYLTDPSDDNPFPYPTTDEARRAMAQDPPPDPAPPRSVTDN